MRPRSLSEFVGNNATRKSLQSIIDSPPAKRPHAFLFAGISGGGKTTLARILATEFKCDDVLEVNAASSTGVDDARAIEKMVQNRPLTGTNRMVILDEVHMLSKNAQSALLKVLEDINEFNYFALCSTDPRKLLPTVRNRCAQVEVRPLCDEDMFKLLDTAADKTDTAEKYGGDDADELLGTIVAYAEGCSRAALMAFEQVVGMDDMQEALLTVRSLDQETEVFALCRLLVKKPGWPKAAKMLQDIKFDTANVEGARRLMLKYLNTCLLKTGNKAKADVFAEMIVTFEDNLYDSGVAGFTRMVYETQQ